MKTNMFKFVMAAFTVIALLAVCALAQATRYNPTGNAVAQANPASTPKPTPTPANAQFIISPNETTIDVPAQKLTVKMSNVATGAGTGSAADLEKQLRAELNGLATKAENATGAAKTASNAVTGLHNELEAEKSARAQGDENLQAQVNAVKADVDSLNGSLQAEVKLRRDADATHDQRLTTIETTRNYGNIAFWLAIAALIGLLAVVIWVSKRKPVIQHQPVNQPPNPQTGSGGAGAAPPTDPPSGGGSDPTNPLKLRTKPATEPEPTHDPKTTPAAPPDPKQPKKFNPKDYRLSENGMKVFRAICNGKPEQFGGDDKAENRNALRVRIYNTETDEELLAIAKEYGVESKDLATAKPRPVPRFRVVEQEEGDVETVVVPRHKPEEEAEGEGKVTDK